MADASPMTREQVLVDGDTLAARLVGQGTHTGVFEGLPPTGRSVRTQELVFYRVVDGKIVGCWGDLFPVVRDALAVDDDDAGGPGAAVPVHGS